MARISGGATITGHADSPDLMEEMRGLRQEFRESQPGRFLSPPQRQHRAEGHRQVREEKERVSRQWLETLYAQGHREELEIAISELYRAGDITPENARHYKALAAKLVPISFPYDQGVMEKPGIVGVDPIFFQVGKFKNPTEENMLSARQDLENLLGRIGKPAGEGGIPAEVALARAHALWGADLLLDEQHQHYVRAIIQAQVTNGGNSEANRVYLENLGRESIMPMLESKVGEQIAGQYVTLPPGQWRTPPEEMPLWDAVGGLRTGRVNLGAAYRLVHEFGGTPAREQAWLMAMTAAAGLPVWATQIADTLEMKLAAPVERVLGQGLVIAGAVLSTGRQAVQQAWERLDPDTPEGQAAQLAAQGQDVNQQAIDILKQSPAGTVSMLSFGDIFYAALRGQEAVPGPLTTLLKNNPQPTLMEIGGALGLEAIYDPLTLLAFLTYKVPLGQVAQRSVAAVGGRAAALAGLTTAERAAAEAKMFQWLSKMDVVAWAYGKAPGTTTLLEADFAELLGGDVARARKLLSVYQPALRKQVSLAGQPLTSLLRRPSLLSIEDVARARAARALERVLRPAMRRMTSPGALEAEAEVVGIPGAESSVGPLSGGQVLGATRLQDLQWEELDRLAAQHQGGPRGFMRGVMGVLSPTGIIPEPLAAPLQLALGKYEHNRRRLAQFLLAPLRGLNPEQKSILLTLKSMYPQTIINDEAAALVDVSVGDTFGVTRRGRMEYLLKATGEWRGPEQLDRIFGPLPEVPGARLTPEIAPRAVGAPETAIGRPGRAEPQVELLGLSTGRISLSERQKIVEALERARDAGMERQVAWYEQRLQALDAQAGGATIPPPAGIAPEGLRTSTVAPEVANALELGRWAETATDVELRQRFPVAAISGEATHTTAIEGIRLGPNFWEHPPSERANILVHEALHNTELEAVVGADPEWRQLWLEGKVNPGAPNGVEAFIHDYTEYLRHGPDELRQLRPEVVDFFERKFPRPTTPADESARAAFGLTEQLPIEPLSDLTLPQYQRAADTLEQRLRPPAAPPQEIAPGQFTRPGEIPVTASLEPTSPQALQATAERLAYERAPWELAVEPEIALPLDEQVLELTAIPPKARRIWTATDESVAAWQKARQYLIDRGVDVADAGPAYTPQVMPTRAGVGRAGTRFLLQRHVETPAMREWLRAAGVEDVGASIMDPEQLARGYGAGMARAELKQDLESFARTYGIWQETLGESPEQALRMGRAIGWEPLLGSSTQFNMGAFAKAGSDLERLFVPQGVSSYIDRILTPYSKVTRGLRWAGTLPRLSVLNSLTFIAAQIGDQITGPMFGGGARTQSLAVGAKLAAASTFHDTLEVAAGTAARTVGERLRLGVAGAKDALLQGLDRVGARAQSNVAIANLRRLMRLENFDPVLQEQLLHELVENGMMGTGPAGWLSHYESTLASNPFVRDTLGLGVRIGGLMEDSAKSTLYAAYRLDGMSAVDGYRRIFGSAFPNYAKAAQAPIDEAARTVMYYWTYWARRLRQVPLAISERPYLAYAMVHWPEVWEQAVLSPEQQLLAEGRQPSLKYSPQFVPWSWNMWPMTLVADRIPDGLKPNVRPYISIRLPLLEMAGDTLRWMGLQQRDGGAVQAILGATHPWGRALSLALNGDLDDAWALYQQGRPKEAIMEALQSRTLSTAAPLTGRVVQALTRERPPTPDDVQSMAREAGVKMEDMTPAMIDSLWQLRQSRGRLSLERGVLVQYAFRNRELASLPPPTFDALNDLRREEGQLPYPVQAGQVSAVSRQVEPLGVPGPTPTQLNDWVAAGHNLTEYTGEQQRQSQEAVTEGPGLEEFLKTLRTARDQNLPTPAISEAALRQHNAKRIQLGLDPIDWATAQKLQTTAVPVTWKGIYRLRSGLVETDPGMCARSIWLSQWGRTGLGNADEAYKVLPGLGFPQTDEPQIGDVGYSPYYGTNENGHLFYVVKDPKSDNGLGILSNFEGNVDLRPLQLGPENQYFRSPTESMLSLELQQPQGR